MSFAARRNLAGVVLLALLGMAGCSGCDDPNLGGEDAGNGHGGPPAECSPTAQTCDQRSSFRDGLCQNTYCESDSECCPSTRCDLTFNLCRSRLFDQPCESDVDCTVSGQKCLERNETMVCAFDACLDDGDCTSGLTCFKGYCVGGNPCPTGCEEDEVCDIPTASCHPARGHASCDVTCEPGTLRTLSNPKTMSGEICCHWECECAELPPLSPGIYGRYASVAVAHLEVDVACFDDTYGDLVVARYDKAGALMNVDYVDGWPEDGTVGGALSGPRQGIIEAGPEVGHFASAAIDPTGRLHIAYFDVTNGALKYAVNIAEGVWRTHVIDDVQVAGQFNAIAIRPVDGIPVVSYFVTGLTDTEGRTASAVKLAVAKTATPAAATDWDLHTLETAPVFDACNHQCFASAICVLDETTTSGTACGVGAAGCSPACSSGQTCVQENGTPVCKPLGNPPIEGLPRADGIFTSVTIKDSDAVVAWYDAVNGDLKSAIVSPAGPGGVVVIDGDGVDGRRGGNVGAYVSLGVDPVGKIAMVYEDLSRHELVFFHSSGLTGGETQVIDTGRGMPPGFHEVGAGASLSIGADGTAYVVYQEQTTLDLMIAQREPDGTWTKTKLLEDGAFGFYADVAVASSMAFIASVLPELDDRQELANKLGLQVVQVPMP